jgi:hypothetical protein
VLAFALLVGCSGALEGEVVTDPVADWSFVADATDVVFATAGGDSFTTVIANPIVHDGALYLSVSTIFTLDDSALDAVLAGDGLRMRADGKVYSLTARLLTEARDIDPILPALVQANGYEATGIRWDPNPERYPGTQMSRWFFRLESESGRDRDQMD